jgi:hypothetical protein
MQAILRHKANVEAKKVQKAEKRKLAKLKGREERKVLRAQEDERRREEKRVLCAQEDERCKRDRDEATMRYLLHQEAIAEARRAQNAENQRLVEQQRMEKRIERERKQLLREQQDQQRRLDRQARDEACMQAHLRYEAAITAKKAQLREKEKLARLRETEQNQALHTQQDERRRKEIPGQDELLTDLGPPAKLGRPRLTRTDSDERQASWRIRDERDHENRRQRDGAGAQAIQRHKAIVQPQKEMQKSLKDGCIVAFDGPLPSFLEEEYQYMKQASTDFPETITPSIQMECMKAYQKAISDASKRLPCGLCGGLFQENDVFKVNSRDENLQYFLRRTETAPDCCAVKDNMVSLCITCNSAVAKRAIPLLSAGNFVNCLFCQDYPEVLKNLNAVEEAFIARAHVVGIFLKLTSGAKKGISYRGSRGHSVAVRQDPSSLLRILPAKRLQDHTTITVS